MLKDKTEVFVVFGNFHAFIITQTGLKLKCLRTDNGGEYISNRISENGIMRELRAPYNPASNGVVERYNKTPCERFQCMLSTANLPNAFWVEALPTTMHIINRSSHNPLRGGIPEEI